MWDWDRLGRNQFLGEVQIPLSSIDLDDSTMHWHALQDKVSKVWTIVLAQNEHNSCVRWPMISMSLLVEKS